MHPTKLLANKYPSEESNVMDCDTYKLICSNAKNLNGMFKSCVELKSIINKLERSKIKTKHITKHYENRIFHAYNISRYDNSFNSVRSDVSLNLLQLQGLLK